MQEKSENNYGTPSSASDEKSVKEVTSIEGIGAHSHIRMVEPSSGLEGFEPTTPATKSDSKEPGVKRRDNMKGMMHRTAGRQGGFDILLKPKKSE